MASSNSTNDNKVKFTIKHAGGGPQVSIRASRTATFSDIFDKFCSKQNLTKSLLRFRYNGQTLNLKETPDLVNLEEGSVINVVPEQTGGY